MKNPSMTWSGRMILWVLTAVVAMGADCRSALADLDIEQTGKIPLCDMGLSDYQGRPGGLYPGRSNTLPDPHLAWGLAMARQIQPLGPDGAPDPNGRIVLISVGMSIANMEFAGSGGPDFVPGCFKTRMDMDPARHPVLVIVNGAQGGQMAENWTDPAFDTWRVLEANLRTAGVTPQQVQAAWVKQVSTEARSRPFNQLVEQTRKDLESIARCLKTLFPNCRIAYYSSRRFSTARYGLSIEPATYEDAFAVREMIERQISGEPDLNHDPGRGPVLAPWLAWGPYLWADGINPRSDGLDWRGTAGGHPSPADARKVTDMLIALCKTDPTAMPWSLRSRPIGSPPVLHRILASSLSGPAPLRVTFTAQADDPDGQVIETLWSFDDGTFGHDSNGSPTHTNLTQATKTFFTPGLYRVRCTVIDDLGNAAHDTIPITVGPPTGDQMPRARFTAQPEVGSIPLEVTLDAATSTDDGQIVSFAWDFDDGTTGLGQTVHHTFTIAGRFMVQLTVTDNAGSTALATIPITAIDPNHNQPPVARFTLDVQVGVLPLTITLDSDPSYDLEGPIVLHAWDFGDGETFIGTLEELGSGAALSHTYNRTGTYIVRLTVTDQKGATDTATAQITVLPGKELPSGDRYVWTFGDGTFSYNPGGGPDVEPFYLNPSPVKTFHNPGVYSAYLTVTDNDGNAVTRTVRVAVTGATPTAVVPGNETAGEQQ